MEKIPVAAYCRVSTATEDQENSFEAQKAYFEKNKIDNFDIVKIYADKGLSGTSFENRPEFLQMLEDAGVDIEKGKKWQYIASDREPKFQRILVTNSSRLARNIMILDIIRELANKGVYVIFLDWNMSTQDISREFIIQIRLGIDQQDSIDRSSKVIFGQFRSAEKGNLFIHNNFYGYTYIKETNSLEINKDEAVVIEKIFNLYAQGFGVRRIVNQLEEENIKTRNGKTFGKTTINRIIHNEKYCGRLARNKWDTGKVFKKITPKLRPKNEWIVTENSDKVPAIISKELFDKVQKIKENRVNSISNCGKNYGVSEFAGKIICGKCGSTYTRNKDGSRTFYNCSKKKTKGVAACDNYNVSLTEIEKKLMSAEISKSVRMGNAAMKVIKMGKYDVKKSLLEQKLTSETSNQLKQKKDELNSLEQKKKKILDLYLEGKFDREDLTRRRIEIDEKIDMVESEIEILTMPVKEVIKELKKVEELQTRLSRLKVKEPKTREEILEEIETIKVCERQNGEKNLKINLKVTKLILDIVKVGANIDADLDIVS